MIDKLTFDKYQACTQKCSMLKNKINEIIDHLPQEKEIEFSIQSVDARVWAKEFNRILVTKGEQPYDEGWLISWFANAIMAGYDKAKREISKPSVVVPSALELAKSFHNIYERLAPDFGYRTRKDTKEFKPNTPNGKLMIAVCNEIIHNLLAGKEQE